MGLAERLNLRSRILHCFVLSIFLLMPGPRYSFPQSDDQVDEYLSGNHTVFSTKDHPKAKGVHFTITYPSGWLAAEGERPNIVQTFTSEGGRGADMVLIVTKDLPLPEGTILTAEDQEELLTPSELKNVLPPQAKFIGTQKTKIEGVPAGILEYSMSLERVGTSLAVQTWSLIFLSGKTLVQIQFTVAGFTAEDAWQHMVSLKPLFTLMANSVVFPDKWSDIPDLATQTASPSEAPTSPPLLNWSPLALELVLSFIITWGVGLTPPLLIRYVIIGRPVRRSTATWIAAGFSAFFWLSFRVLNAALGEEPGTGGIAWVIVFFVARWIMSRGYVQPAQGMPAPRARQGE